MMIVRRLAAALVLTSVSGASAGAHDTAVTVHSPAEAIAMAKQMPSGKSGRFRMTVAATGTTPNGTFLNSTADYRGDDNLTIRVRPFLAALLAKRYGVPAATYFMGRQVTVDGRVRQQLIVNMVAGRPHSGNRYQHEIDVDQASQIVAVE